MASPGHLNLIRVLKQLEAPDRALLELCLRHRCGDDDVAELIGSTSPEVRRRRAALILDIANEAGCADPPGLLAIRRALTELPGSAWSGDGAVDELPDVTVGAGGSAPAPATSADSAASLPAPPAVQTAIEESAKSRVPDQKRKVRWGGAGAMLPDARHAAMAATLVLPASLILYLSFDSGGFFVGEPAVAALIVIFAMLLRLAFGDRPFEGFSVPLGVAVAALAMFAAWTLGSSAWSHAPSRALLEFDRTLLYLLVLVLTGSVTRSETRMRWMFRGMTLAIVVVCCAGLTTRLLPDLWPVDPNTADLGLNYPLTYSNAVGLLAALAVVFTLHLASDTHEPRPVRVLSAAVLPLLAATLILTLSRGAISVGVLGVFAYALLGRPRGLLTALAATAPATAVAVVVSYRADLLHSPEYTSGVALEQGHDVALVVVLCSIASLVLRALLLSADERPGQLELLGRLRGRALAGAVTVAVAASILAGLAVDAPAYLSRQYQLFLDKGSIPTEQPRARVASTFDNGRSEFWDVALDTYRRAPLLGNGAGTYALMWARHRPKEDPATDGHSLYVEVLGELGLVGLVLVVGAIVAVLGRLAFLSRGPCRALYAALLAGGSLWAVQAGFDWHWEMPAVTLPFFALGGLALAASRPVLRAPSRLTRLGAGVALVLIAITPAQIAVSQHRLDDAYHAFNSNRCDVASQRAVASIAALGSRPEPYEMLAYCEAGGRLGRLAVQRMQQAVDRDPENWRLHYGLAIVLGSARLDPRPAARAALRLNPRGFLPRTAAKSFGRAREPDAWQRVARNTQLPVY